MCSSHSEVLRCSELAKILYNDWGAGIDVLRSCLGAGDKHKKRCRKVKCVQREKTDQVIIFFPSLRSVLLQKN